MKNIKIIFTILISMFFSACSQQEMAKQYGGTYVINLERGKKLVNITWKNESDLWILTRTMSRNDSSEKYEFSQDKGKVLNVFGDGKVVILESK